MKINKITTKMVEHSKTVVLYNIKLRNYLTVIFGDDEFISLNKYSTKER